MTHELAITATERQEDVNRRSFLTQGAGLGLALGLPPLLASCGGDSDGSRTVAASAIGPQDGKHVATLFFNLSHEAHAGKTYYLTGGGQKLSLTPVAERPEVLRLARQGNAFLRSVADSQITHHVEAATFSSACVTVCYISADLPGGDGTWSMSSVQLYIPPAGAARAYAARQSIADAPWPLSAKRRRYGVAPAQSEQDLRDERALFDSTSHAATIAGFQPDLMAMDPGAAHTIHSNHVDLDINVYNLGQALTLSQYGPAQPQQGTGPNTNGWGTLVPVRGDDGTPLRNKTGQHAGRIQYLPSLQSTLRGFATAGSFAAGSAARDDVSLGADATPLSPGAPLDLRLTGKMWLRHDGLTRVDQIPGLPTATAAAVKMVLDQQNPQVAFKVGASATASGSSTTVTLTFTNWFLEFRGVWLQFLDVKDQVLQLNDLPEYGAGSIVSGHDKTGDMPTGKPTDMFISLVGPAFTVLAIPVEAGTFKVTFNVPTAAHTVRVLSSTISFQRSDQYIADAVPGAVMTGIVNYGLTALLGAAGAGPFIPAMYKTVILGVAQALALELVTILSNEINGGKPLTDQIKTAAFWENQALILAKVLITRGSMQFVKGMVEWVIGAITEAVAEDSIPVVGQIMQAISFAVAVANVVETDVALAVAPWTYVDDLIFTHDLPVQILRANDATTFPGGATSYTVTALFDSGTPYVQRFDLQKPDNPPATVPIVAFKNVPLGGNVNVSVAFVRESALPGVPDILLGKGSSGRVVNDANAAPSFRIDEIQYPINSATVYRHSRKTSLDPAGNHAWLPGAAPKENAGNTTLCGNAGTLCGFRSITVRQGSGDSEPTYIGYAWESQNFNPSIAPSCIGGTAGQLDQLANLNEAAGNAQQGYANGSCGIGGHGVRVAYSLLAKGSQSFYLDTTDPSAPMVRRVLLDGAQPAFVSNEAWGALNFASDALLLHPAGKLVSINRTLHKIETLRIPPKALSDADAQQMALAKVQCGKGTRPGLMSEPVAAAVGADGTILILEAGNNRIQAFDLGGNPVRHFPNSPSPYSLTLGGTDPQNWQYLDLAVEYTGYLYVLSFKPSSFEYRLDIYHPGQSGNQPISTTPNVNAARLAVDFWRNVYTLNYEALKLSDGKPAGLTEPSVSLWVP